MSADRDSVSSWILNITSRATATSLVAEALTKLRCWPQNVAPTPVLVFVDLSARKAPIEDLHRIIIVTRTATHSGSKAFPGPSAFSGPKALSRSIAFFGSKAPAGTVVAVPLVMPPTFAERDHGCDQCNYWNQHQQSITILSPAVSTLHSPPAFVPASVLTVGTSRDTQQGRRSSSDSPR